MMFRGPRHKVLWFGGAPHPDWTTECTNRHLQLEVFTGTLNPQQLTTGKGVIVAIDPGLADDLLCDPVRALLGEATQHGIGCFVSCTIEDSSRVAAELKRWGLRPSVDILIRGQELPPIETIARRRYEPSVNANLQLEGHDPLFAEERILLRRSFSDCESVKLVRQTTGSTKVFCAFAQLLHSRAGPIPLPFFVKFDRVDKIQRELTNYRECTTLHVPFNQRPNLDDERCIIGLSKGIIVGNFVEQSESLQEVVDRGAGRAALHSLFEGALRGWRRQAFYDPRYVMEANILHGMHLARPSTYAAGRKARLRRRHQRTGSASLPPEALETMLSNLPATKYRFGITHGDLHGDNVRVAGNDAILIDFASIAEGPLTADPAALDVSLMLGTRTVSGSEWIELAELTYNVNSLVPPLQPPRPEHSAASVLEAVHYIRQMAANVHLTTYEYPLVVALQLIRKASYGSSDDEQEQRRYVAYRLADRIIRHVSEQLSKQSAP